MHDHGEILALAATAIDFDLDPAERERLRDALDTCSLCRRQASAMRATATILSRPPDIGTPARVRDVVVGAALRGSRPAPALRSLVLASLSVLVVLAGTVFVAGNRGLFVTTPAPSQSASAMVEVSPSPSMSPAPASPSQTSIPTASPEPTPTEGAPTLSMPPADTGPLHAGDVAAMVTDGRLVIRTKPGTGADSAVFKTKLYPGQRVLTLEGPVEASGYPWYRVRLGMIEGWAAAAGLEGEPWLTPVRNGAVASVGSADDGASTAIYTVDLDRLADASPLFADAELSDYDQLTWSSDGARLAFVARPADGNGTTEIFTVDADGSNLVRITQNEVNDDSPAWSPDGTRLALRVDDVDPNAPGDSNVVVATAVGPGITVLGPGANPVWSPDGSQIAMTVADGGSTRIWVQAPNGADRRQVADVAVAAVAPAWSPDGQHLLVSSSGLSLIEVATGTVVQLTAEPGSAPAWSISGTIAFATTGSASPGIFVMNADGSDLRRLSADPGVVSSLAWSPDERWLLVDVEGRGQETILDPATGAGIAIGPEVRALRSSAWRPRLP